MSCGRALGYTGGREGKEEEGAGQGPLSQDLLFLVPFDVKFQREGKCSGTVHHCDLSSMCYSPRWL